MESLKSNTVEYEVIMAGPLEPSITDMFTSQYPQLKYIQTADIKVAQCYEIARLSCIGDLIAWISDDCRLPEGALDKVYNKLVDKDFVFNKTILALPTHDPACPNNSLNDQRFFSRNLNTPQMAQIGFMSRKYLEKLGGLDRRYVYGKWESDICMRVLADGGQVLKFEDVVVEIDHTSKNGHLTNDWSGVNEDSETLENSWVIGGYKDFEKPLYAQTVEGNIMVYFPISNREVTLKRLDTFEPFEDKDIIIKSQSLKSRWC